MITFLSKFTAWSFAIKRSCVIPSKAFDRSAKEVPNVPPLLRILFGFFNHGYENSTEILIRQFLPFDLSGYKWDAHKFLKARVRYSTVDGWFYHNGFNIQQ